MRRHNWSFPSRLALAVGLLVAWQAVVFAQAKPGSAPGAKEESTELRGKDAFSLERFEYSLFDEKAKTIQKRMSDIRKKKQEKLQTLIAARRPSANRASHLFRLAETMREEAKYQYLLARERYDQEYDCYEEKRCTTMPIEPHEQNREALEHYRTILREHQTYRRIDEVKYHLGRAALDAGKTRKDIQLQKEGVQSLDGMIQDHPQTRYVPQAHLALAEYFFETDSLFYAKTHYEKIIQNFPKSPMFNYALYKLGWVYFNLTEFEKTITTFKKVIASISGQGVSRGRVEFRAQALNDLIVAWAEIDNGWMDARRYFLQEVGEEDTYKKLEKMAGLLVSKDKDYEAIDLYKHLIEHDKASPKVVEFYDAIWEVGRKVEDDQGIERFINEFAAYFDHRGTWWTANRGDVNVSARADEMVSTGLNYLANRYHRAAQKLDDKRKASGAEYEKAAHYYERILSRFPDHPQTYVYSFYFAEILYHQLKDYEKAARRYEVVLDRDKKGKYVEDAALGVIYAIEEMMVQQGLKERGKKEIEYVAREKETDIRAQDLKPIPRTELADLESRYVAAADTYVKTLEEALGDPAFKKKYPRRGEKIPNIMFIAAQTFYKHGQFAEAVNRLMVIFDLYPKHKMASIAVTTIIDAYARLKHWDKIEKWARSLIEQRNFKVKTKSELQQMIAIALTESARDLTKARRFDEAVAVQEKLVMEFGGRNKELASKAQYNIGVIHETARRFPEAVEAYSRVLRDYPKEDIAVQAQFDIGVVYENQTEFLKAAEAFIKLQRFKSHDKAADALRNAGLIYEATEQYRLAHETFERYIKTFKTQDDLSKVAFHSADVLTRSGEPKDYVSAAKAFERIAKSYGKKDAQYKLRSVVGAALALKKANKTKHRRKVVKLLRSALAMWAKLDPSTPPVPGSKAAKRIEKAKAARLKAMKARAKAIEEGRKPKPLKVAKKKAKKKATGPTEEIEASTKAYAALGALELAEYTFDDYDKLTIEAIRKKGPKKGKFDVKLLKKTLIAKAESLGDAEKAFEYVLSFKDPGMAAAGAFRGGQLMYKFAQSLFNAPVPPELTDEEDIDEYRFQLGEFAAPIEEKSLKRFTQALKKALEDDVYNKWSRKSAEYAAKVNPDEFPLSQFTVAPDKTKDTLTSTSFIKILRRGDQVVDFSKSKDEQEEEEDEGEGDGAGETTGGSQ